MINVNIQLDISKRYSIYPRSQ